MGRWKFVRVCFFYFGWKYNGKMGGKKKMGIFVIVFNVFIRMLGCKLVVFSILEGKSVG